MSVIGRREVLTRGLAAAALAAGAGSLLTSRLAFAAGGGDARFVFIILRGALDGLTAVPPIGDPAYAGLRGEIAVGSPGTDAGAVRLDATFGLHPSLAFMAEAWQARQLTVLHAIASPYRERSHFDGQDVLESGHTRAHASESGWLNRALVAVPSGAAATQAASAMSAAKRRGVGVALGANIPLVMRGSAEVASWSPSRLSVLDDDTLQRVADLYAQDPVLARRLAEALSTDAIAQSAQKTPAPQPAEPSVVAGGDSRDKNDETVAQRVERARQQYGKQYAETVRAAANFLKRDDGPRVAVFDTTGWDTHANEGGGKGQLAARLGALDGGLRVLRDSLGPIWNHTAVLIATEFGRTAAINGTRGTDHGTGAAAFLLGGAVRGGKVLADWPGLSAGSLYEGRDLKPTTDMRSVMKSLMRDHLAVPRRHIDAQVFPDSAAAPYIQGLV